MSGTFGLFLYERRLTLNAFSSFLLSNSYFVGDSSPHFEP